MILRYQKFIQRLNNIQKVCILHNMLVDGLSLVRAPAATAQCYPSQAGRGWFDDEAMAIEKSVLHSGSDYSVN